MEAQYFVSQLNAKNPCDPKYINPSYIEKLKMYNFEGNTRELRNVVERSYYLCEETMITSKYLIGKNVKVEVPINNDSPKQIWYRLEFVQQ